MNTTAKSSPALEPSLKLVQRVLLYKIVITTLLWALPFLLAPTNVLQLLMGAVPEPIFNLRLLGWAYVALITGYIGGLLQARGGVMPLQIIAMGLVSNGGASLLVLGHLVWGTGADLRGIPAFLTWFSGIALALITMGLLLAVAQYKRALASSFRPTLS
ncbi:MAG: hypothetical protein AAGI44_19965 [Pseudomonadota bacterium]